MFALQKSINIQIASNHGKNLFYDDISRAMNISPELIASLQNKNLLDEDISILIDYTAENVVRELCRVNQYFSFSEDDISALKAIYAALYRTIRENELSSLSLLSENHVVNLKNWLASTNPFALEMYQSRRAVLDAAACSEYSFSLQKDILGLHDTALWEPLLDIGCGKTGKLVKSLLAQNIDAHGIDRFAENAPHFEKADWLTYDYGVKKWGTIVSNLGFSNHFAHHHARNDGNIVQYAQTYMRILQSLKTGGSFYYAPDLPFIEIYLDEKRFSIAKHRIDNLPFCAVTITRLD